MTAATIPTRPTLLQRATRHVRAAYLRALIASADRDAAMHEWHATTEPLLAEIARNRAGQLRAKLALIK